MLHRAPCARVDLHSTAAPTVHVARVNSSQLLHSSLCRHQPFVSSSRSQLQQSRTLVVASARKRRADSNYLYPGNTWEDDDDIADRLLSRYPPTERDLPPVKKYEKPAPKTIGGRPLVMNRDIKASQVRVMDQEKELLGVMSLMEAMAIAQDEDVDLILVSPDASPPVARLIPWSKYKYEIEKADKARKKASTQTETKEIRMRPATDVHDFNVKVKSAQKFIEKGCRVKLTMQFEGRELQFKDQGKELLLKFIEDTGAGAKVDGPLNFRGGKYSVMLVPAK